MLSNATCTDNLKKEIHFVKALNVTKCKIKSVTVYLFNNGKLIQVINNDIYQILYHNVSSIILNLDGNGIIGKTLNDEEFRILFVGQIYCETFEDYLKPKNVNIKLFHSSKLSQSSKLSLRHPDLCKNNQNEEFDICNATICSIFIMISLIIYINF